MSEALYEQRSLGDAVERHIGGGTPPRQVPSYWKGEIPWASVKDFSEQKGVIQDTEEHISSAGLHASASNLIPEKTPLVCTRMAVGRAALPVVPMAINQDVKALFPASGVSAEYLLKLMQYIQPLAEGRAVGSTVKGIRIQDYLNIPVPLAPQEAQPVIAQILDTLDTAIRETEALIDKLKAVKQGLLHDLLTRGIDASGQLRPPQSAAPQLYKASPLGWIPREWEALSLADVADLQVGFAFKSEWFLDVGRVRLLRGDNVGYGSPEWGGVKYLSDEAAQRFAGYLLKEGDVVVGMDRTFTKTGSKFSLVTREDLPCLLVQRVGRFMPKLCSMGFLRQLTLWPIFQQDLLAQQKGMDIPHLSKSEILSPFVPVPTACEQGAISDRMASFEQRITAESNLMAKLKSQKSGLMSDLLAGRVRVTPLLESVQQPAAQTEA